MNTDESPDGAELPSVGCQPYGNGNENDARCKCAIAGTLGREKSPAELEDWRGFFIHELLEFHEFGGARERRAGKMRRREIGRCGNEGRNGFAPKFEMMIMRSKKKCFPGENSLLDDLHTGGGHYCSSHL